MYTIKNNSPQIGCIEWAGLNMQYNGLSYKIADGYTNAAYAYWSAQHPNNLVVTNTYPTLGTDDCIVFLNKSGTALVVPGASSVDGGLIVPGSIFADALAANSVTADAILAGAITTDKIAANAVTASTVAADAIGASAIAAGAVQADNIVSGAITTAKIAANAITTDKIAAGAITAATVAADAIGASAIAAGAVQADNIVSGAITTAKIATDAITAEKIAANAITAGKIVANAITADKLATNSVTAIKIAANAVTTDKIAANAITAGKINVEELSALSANLGTVTAGVIRSANFEVNEILNTVWSGVELDLNNESFRTPQITIRENYIDAFGNFLAGTDNQSISYWGNIVAGSGNAVGVADSRNYYNFNAIIAGESNTITTADYSAIISGKNHVISHDHSVVIGGIGHTTTSTDSLFLAGKENIGNGGIAIGGKGNEIWDELGLGNEGVAIGGTQNIVYNGVAIGGEGLRVRNGCVVVGKYNADSPSTEAVFIVGGGTSSADRKDVLVIGSGGSIFSDSGIYANGNIESKGFLRAPKIYYSNNTADEVGARFTEVLNKISSLSTNLSTNYAKVGHNHDSVYAAKSHTHNYAATNHNHDSAYAAKSHTHNYAATNHNHDSAYAAKSHSHGSVSYSGFSISMSSSANFNPQPTGEVSLGSSGYKFKRLVLTGGTVTTSDRNLKCEISDIDERYENAFLNFKPKMYMYKNFVEKDNHDRIHCGIIAQQVESALQKEGLSSLEFAGLCKDYLDKPNKAGEMLEYSFNYSELHGLEIHMIQKAFAKIQELTSRVVELEKMVTSTK